MARETRAREIREALYKLLATTPNTGVVHRYRRYARDWKDVLDNLRVEIDGKVQIRGWMIGRSVATAGSLLEPQTFDEVSRAYTFELIGVAQVEDEVASELTFEDVVEDVMTALEDSNDLYGVAVSGGVSQPRLQTFAVRAFTGVLCHYAEISVDIGAPRRSSLWG